MSFVSKYCFAWAKSFLLLVIFLCNKIVTSLIGIDSVKEDLFLKFLCGSRIDLFLYQKDHAKLLIFLEMLAFYRNTNLKILNFAQNLKKVPEKVVNS